MPLKAFEEQIKNIDDEILKLFEKRMSVIENAAQDKAEGSVPVINRMREREILARVTKNLSRPLDDYAKVMFLTLFDIGRSYQSLLLKKPSRLQGQIADALKLTPDLFPKKAVVACQGIEGAYSQMACDKLFSLPNILYFKNFEGVFSAVENGLCEFGILPIENSSYGSVNQVYDLMRHYNFHIVRSIKLQIHHSLLAKTGVSLSEIREIVSHEQAIGQCTEFLKSLPNVKITVCENTAVAAKLVAESERRDIAAISSKNCAELYSLSVLSNEIKNNASNYTRFICIAKDMLIFPGANKISLMFTLPHTPGSLYRMISKFSVIGVDLTKIESRPISGMDFEFLFYFDMDASVSSFEVMSLLGELSEGPEQFTFLGNYSEI